MRLGLCHPCGTRSPLCRADFPVPLGGVVVFSSLPWLCVKSERLLPLWLSSPSLSQVKLVYHICFHFVKHPENFFLFFSGFLLFSLAVVHRDNDGDYITPHNSCQQPNQLFLKKNHFFLLHWHLFYCCVNINGIFNLYNKEYITWVTLKRRR